jgi:ubiquinone/menaquinone biosynthesis C-methylase UbiE
MASKRMSLPFRIHYGIISKLARPWSTSLLRAKVLACLGPVANVLDVSCGCGMLICDIAKLPTVQFAVANDLSYGVLAFLRKNTIAHAEGVSAKIAFVNANLFALPFTAKFDLIVCKNTLHHMHDPHEMLRLLAILEHSADQLIIIDVEHPYKSGWLAWLWHQYYTMFLREDDACFLTKAQFQLLLKTAFPSAELVFDEQRTIKGTYLLCHVRFKTLM